MYTIHPAVPTEVALEFIRFYNTGIHHDLPATFRVEHPALWGEGPDGLFCIGSVALPDPAGGVQFGSVMVDWRQQTFVLTDDPPLVQIRTN